MWWFIGIIVLIAIIFGVSLHNAFWGLVAFAVGLVITCFALYIASNTAGSLYKWLNKTLNKNLTKKAVEQKCQSILSAIVVLTVIVCVIAIAGAIFSLLIYGDLSFGFNH